jgi:mRNA deadenylase 3'-5' endonuclease subunit Ccr4
MIMVVSSALSSSHLIYPATLPNTHDQLSVLSYNVLLPNSLDGWWNYKMYQPSSSLSDEVISNISSWDYRSDLIRNKIQTLDPDVVCMQEVSPLSFTQDFEFMKQLGYDGVEMFRRGRFRPATFWKTEKCHLVHDAVHKDRTLLTCFELNNLDESHACFGRYWHVLNCHLQAGPEGKRRVRQIDDGVKASFKLAKKLNGMMGKLKILLLPFGLLHCI